LSEEFIAAIKIVFTERETQEVVQCSQANKTQVVCLFHSTIEERLSPGNIQPTERQKAKVCYRASFKDSKPTDSRLVEALPRGGGGALQVASDRL
jgi:hypothetical protein